MKTIEKITRVSITEGTNSPLTEKCTRPFSKVWFTGKWVGDSPVFFESFLHDEFNKNPITNTNKKAMFFILKGLYIKATNNLV